MGIGFKRKERSMYIGIDIGTTSSKAILFNRKGESFGKFSAMYPLETPYPRHKEQDPDLILEGVIKILSEAYELGQEMGEEIEFISFSTMMHSLMAVDDKNRPLTQCITWADSRSIDYVEEFKKNGRGLELYRRTGTPQHPMSPFYKLMWLRDKDRENFKRAHKFISIKEYIFYEFFGDYLVDYSMASATGMFNIYDLVWDREALDLVGIDENRLSRPVPTTEILRGLRPAYRDRLGFKEEIPFVIGATDGCLANLGSKGIDRGSMVITIGTSGAVRVVSDKPLIDRSGRTFSYILTEDKFVSGGPINNGGIVYRWFRDNFSEREREIAHKNKMDPYDLINRSIEKVGPGSRGLLFYPFLTGERAPFWDANLRGAYLGISDSHRKEDFARSLIEGICFSLRSVYNVLEELMGKVDRIYVNGGFTRSEEWLRILASVMDKEIVVSENYETPSLGAVMLGLLATGQVDSLEELDSMLDRGRSYYPDQNRKVYDDLFKIYMETVEGIMEVSNKLVALENL